MRQLKYHEKKLLKKVRVDSLGMWFDRSWPWVASDDDVHAMKRYASIVPPPRTIPHETNQPTNPQINRQVDFLQWKSDANIREVKILRRYHIQDREDYVKCVTERG